MTGEKCVLQLWHHGVLVTHHTFEQRLAFRDVTNGVGAQFFFDGHRLPTGCAQGSECGGQGRWHFRLCHRCDSTAMARRTT